MASRHAPCPCVRLLSPSALPLLHRGTCMVATCASPSGRCALLGGRGKHKTEAGQAGHVAGAQRGWRLRSGAGAAADLQALQLIVRCIPRGQWPGTLHDRYVWSQAGETRSVSACSTGWCVAAAVRSGAQRQRGTCKQRQRCKGWQQRAGPRQARTVPLFAGVQVQDQVPSLATGCSCSQQGSAGADGRKRSGGAGSCGRRPCGSRALPRNSAQLPSQCDKQSPPRPPRLLVAGAVGIEVGGALVRGDAPHTVPAQAAQAGQQGACVWHGSTQSAGRGAQAARGSKHGCASAGATAVAASTRLAAFAQLRVSMSPALRFTGP